MNRLHDGQRFTGPFTQRLLAEDERIATGKPNPVAGKEIYSKYCVACHQPDGRGGTVAADFVGDKTRLAKSDTELIRSIRRGFDNEKVVMPPFESVLSEPEMRNVLAYIREAFDPIRARGR